MAIQSIKEKITLRLELDGGLVDGKQKIDSKSFTKLKAEAEDTNLHGTATVIAGLQDRDLVKVKKIETLRLISE